MLPFHIIAFGFVLGVIAVADREALSWFLGKTQTLERKRFHHYHVLIWGGLTTLIVTGGIMFYPMRTFLLRELLFDIKMLFVFILVINGILIGRLMEHAFEKPYAALTREEKISLLTSAFVSGFGWAGAALIALWIF